jgi:hypothetical protein
MDLSYQTFGMNSTTFLCILGNKHDLIGIRHDPKNICQPGFIQMYNTELVIWLGRYFCQSIRQDYHQRFESHMMKTKNINKSASDLIGAY